MTKTEMAHIWLDEKGTAWIDDTGVKVIEVVRDHIICGLSPLEIHREFPDLSLAQIHAALAYYYDHKEELDAELAEWEQEIEALRKQTGETPVHRKLRAMGLI
jgi:uncharacterized protein (DUF433 family)